MKTIISERNNTFRPISFRPILSILEFICLALKLHVDYKIGQ